jgi:alpha-beta hydrolase superfamily lysophospholipase
VSDSFSLTAPDGASIVVYRWLPSGSPRSVVQISHGAAEHAARYDRVARDLVQAGHAVYADDHRGHGRTAEAGPGAGIAGPDSWNAMLADGKLLTDHIAEAHPGVPIVLLGHSMGSLLAQGYIQRWGPALRAVALSGTADSLPAGAEDLAERVRAAIDRDGRDAPSEDFGLLFADFNEHFVADAPADGLTGFEWLSRDEAEVRAYVEDPWCGFPLSNGMVIDMADVLEETWAPGRLEDIPKELPILVFAGDRDPVGEFGAGIHRLVERYREVGLTVTEILYPDARHEIFNETNRDQVHRDLIGWLDEVLA